MEPTSLAPEGLDLDPGVGMNNPSFLGGAEPQQWMASSTAPLGGVLLSLVALWISTTPHPLHAVNLDIGSDCPLLMGQPPLIHTVVIDSDGTAYWDGDPLVDRVAIDARMRAVGAKDLSNQSEVRIKPHKRADYGAVAAVMASAQRNGVQRMSVLGGVVSIPAQICAARRID